MSELERLERDLMSGVISNFDYHVRLNEISREQAGEMYPTECPDCEGYGKQGRRITVYEHGCGFGHDDVEEWDCPECDGTGQTLQPYQPPVDE